MHHSLQALSSSLYILIRLKKYIDYLEEKMVLGEQIQRVEVNKMHKLLHRSIGALTFTSGQQLNAGKGVIISPDLVLSAAHNIYDRASEKHSKNMRFYLGACGPTERYQEIVDWKFPDQFRTCSQDQRHKFDYALLRLKDKITLPEYLPITIVNPCFPLTQVLVEIYGYPATRGNFRPVDEEGRKIKLFQYGLARTGRVNVDFQQSLIRYTISTQKGQSGCPIAMQGGIVGVHLAGGGSFNDFNIGRLIDIGFVRTLRKWCKQLKATSFRVQGEDINENTVVLQSHLEIKNGHLKQIVLNAYVNLLQLHLPENQLQFIDLRSNYQLQTLDLSKNKLTSINLSRNPMLKYVFLNYNRLELIQIQKNSRLKKLQLQSNKLQVLNVSSNVSLTQLKCGRNHLKEIDLTKNINLIKLRMQSNYLKTINLSRNIDLTEVRLYENQIQSINFRANIDLKLLKIQANQLEEIDLSFLQKLQELSLFKNRLSLIKLNVSPFVPVEKYNMFRLQAQRSSRCKIELTSDPLKFDQIRQGLNAKLMLESQNQSLGCQYQISRK